MQVSYKKFWTVGLTTVLLFISNAIFAASSPVPMLQSVANQMLAQLQKNKNQLSSNPAIIHRIVNSTLVPHIDIDRMAGSVVGRNYWMSATPAQRSQFIKEFKTMVINTYANALASYNNDQVQFAPFRGVAGNSAQVNSTIIRQNGQRIAVSYNLSQTSGAWKIYDFSIENVSIVRNYNSQFASTLAQGGMTALLQRISAHNRGR